MKVLFCFGFLLIAGFEHSFAGWIPSYAVLSEVADRAEATLFNSVFWMTSTLFRFIVASLTWSSSRKIKLLTSSLLLCSIVCLVMLLSGNIWITVTLSSFLFGTATSAIFPLLISLPTEFGVRFRPDEIATIMMTAVLSSEVLPSVVGVLMGHNIDYLFVWLLILSGLLWIILKLILKEMEVGG